MSNTDELAKFDITTAEGKQQALNWLDKHGWIFLGSFWLYWKAGQFLVNAVKSLTSDAVVQEIEEQKKAAVEIIKAGQEAGVDELEITMSERAGIGLKSELEGLPIDLIAGSSGKFTLKVKYKSQSSATNIEN